MSKTSTIQQAVKFANDRMVERFGKLSPEWGSVHSNDSSAHFTLTRTFNIQVSVNLDFTPSRDGKHWLPVVRVNAPAINLQVVQATAMLAVLQEATLFAATLQAQLEDGFEIPFQ